MNKSQVRIFLPSAAAICLLLIWMSCEGNARLDVASEEVIQAEDTAKTDSIIPGYIRAFQARADWIARGFDFPVGKPNASGYYNAQTFGENQHLGDDWNGRGGGNTDRGDDVCCIADGWVSSALDHFAGWGNVVRVVHKVESDSGAVFMESLYAHLDTIWVEKGDYLKKGDLLGTIGDAHGAYYAHLHLELRNKPGMSLGGGYGKSDHHIDPTAFIRGHRNR